MADSTNPNPPSWFCYGNQAFLPLHTEFSYPFEPTIEPQTDEKSFLRNEALPRRQAEYVTEIEAEPQRQIYNANLAQRYEQTGGRQDVFGRWVFPSDSAISRPVAGRIYSLGPISSAPPSIRWRDGPLSAKSSIPYIGYLMDNPWETQFGALGSELELSRDVEASSFELDGVNHYVLVAEASGLEFNDRDILAEETPDPLNEFLELSLDGESDICDSERDGGVVTAMEVSGVDTGKSTEVPSDQAVQVQEETTTHETPEVPKPKALLWATVLRTVSGGQPPPSGAVVDWAIPAEASNFRKMKAAETTECTSKYIADPTSYSYSLHVEDLEDEKNCALWVTNLKRNITAAKLFQVIKEGPVFILHICPPSDQHHTAAAKLVFMTPGAAAAFMERTLTETINIDGLEVKAVYNRTGYRKTKETERTRVLIIMGAKEHMNRDRWLKYFSSCVRFELEADCVYVDDHDENMLVMEFRFVRVETQSEMIYRALIREKNFGGVFSFGFGPDPCDKS